MAIISGRGRDRIRRADGSTQTTPWQSNLIVRSGYDLIAEQMVGSAPTRPTGTVTGATDSRDRDLDGALGKAFGRAVDEARDEEAPTDRPLPGIGWLAIGAGDPSWDATAPEPDLARTELVDEVARVALRPGSAQLRFLTSQRVVQVRATFGAGIGTGPIREVGIFGGHASARAGSGLLLNHLVHPVIVKGDGDRLLREIEIELSETLGERLRALIGGRLVNATEDAIIGIAVGTDSAAATEAALGAEQFRRGLYRDELRYNPDRARIEVEAQFDHDVLHDRWPTVDGSRSLVQEVGLVIGQDLSTAPLTLIQSIDGRDLDDSEPMTHRFELALGNSTQVAVPDVVGELLGDVQSRLGSDLILGEVSETNRPGVTSTQVVAQVPEAGSLVPQLSAVDVVISRRRTVVVPAVVGLPVDRATTAVTARSLSVGETLSRLVDDPTDFDQVVAVEPPAGTVVDRDSSVTITVGQPATITMPDLVDLAVDNAERRLRSAGFVGEIDIAEVPTAYRHGLVATQSPAADAEVRLDVPISLGRSAPIIAKVPEITGMSIDEAIEVVAAAAAELHELHGIDKGVPALAIGSIRTRPVSDSPSTVLDQDPPAGEPIEVFSTVDVTIAVGEKVLVPDLVGMDRAAVVAVLSGLGLRLGTVHQRSVLADPDQVVEQDPKPGTVLAVGLPVSITVAAQARVVVPNLFGLGLDGVAEALAARALRLGDESTVVTDGTPGTVFDQVPSAGMTVDADSAVSIRLVAGVPNVVGLAQSEAEAAIRVASLTPRVEEIPGGGPVGQVLRQSPRAGSAIPQDRVVTISVATAIAVGVPDLHGTGIDKATSELEAIGLKPDFRGVERGDPQIPPGFIVRQQPEARTEVEPGTAVSFWAQETPGVVVIDVVGAKLDAAVEKLNGLGLSVEVGEPVSETGPAGIVAAQDPKAGTRVPVDSTVVIHPFSAESLQLPDLTGLPLGRATALAKELGFDHSFEDTFEQVPAADGMERFVVAQEPAAGPLRAGETVRLFAGILLPDLVGVDVQKAQRELKLLELRFRALDAGGNPTTVGTVSRTDPEAGTPLRRGDGVLLRVGFSFDPVIDPPIVGPVIDPGVVGPVIGLGPLRRGPGDLGPFRR